ncbi:MAG: hypothetical protein LAO09_10985 [Acidobacteriia bacterium]|nr:hypothetical protein [Terriglobia bacterium]
MDLSGADRKPRGWLAIGIFLLWGAAIATLAGVTLIFPGTPLDRAWVLNPRGHAGLTALGRWVGFLFPVLGLLLATAGIGWLKRRSWGWMLAVLLIGGNALGDAVRMAIGAWIEGAVGVVIAGALLLYIISRGVRDYFG